MLFCLFEKALYFDFQFYQRIDLVILYYFLCYYLYSLIFANGNKDQAAILKQYFDRCENQHLNAIWATEKLYILGNTKEQFGNILEENLSLVYDSAKLQEYEEWVL